MTIVQNTFPEDARKELQLSRLYLLQDLLNVMQQNLNLQLEGQPGFLTSENSGNVFALAAKYYGDATLWTEIASINQNQLTNNDGFIDPNINLLINLIIPPKPSTESGGILIV